MNEIFKSDKPVQFPLDEIIDETKRLARSWMSVEVKDIQGEVIPISAFKKVMNTWMSRGAPIMDVHSNKHVGRGLNWKEATHPKSGKPAIELDYQIFDDYELDDVVWDEIKSNKRKGLSVGGTELGIGEYVKDGDGLARQMSGIEMYEVSSVHEPANQLALNTAINYLAKSDSDLPVNEFAIGFKLESAINKSMDSNVISQTIIDNFKLDPKYYTHLNQDIGKGFSSPKYSSFKECKDAQVKAGHSEPSADRLAKWIMSGDKESGDETEKDNNYPQDKSATTQKQSISRSSEDVNNKSEVNEMSNEANKEDKETPEVSTDDRLESLEKSMETIKATLVKMVPEDNDKTAPVEDEVVDKQDNPEDEAEKKKSDETEDDETKKEEPSSIGQDDTESPPAGEKVNMDNEQGIHIQKMVSKELKKALAEVGINSIKKSITPRPAVPLKKEVKKDVDPAMDMLNKTRTGQMSKAQMTREIVKMHRESYEKGIAEVLNR